MRCAADLVLSTIILRIRKRTDRTPVEAGSWPVSAGHDLRTDLSGQDVAHIRGLLGTDAACWPRDVRWLYD